MRRSSSPVAVLALLVGVSACGSTVQIGSRAGSQNEAQVGSQQGLEGELPSSAGTPSAGAGDSTGAPTFPASGAVGSTGTGSTTRGVVGSSTGGTGGPSVPGPAVAGRNGVGVTARSLDVGVLYVKNYDQANSQNGGASITGGDLLADAKAVVNDINAHGGIAGRRLVAHYYGYDRTSADSQAAQDQAACTALTQDTKVFAVLGTGLTNNFKACIEQAGGSVIGAEIVKDDQATFRRYPHFFDVQAVDTERFAAGLHRVVDDQRWLSGWNAGTGKPAAATKARVGVVMYDTPAFRSALKVFRTGDIRVDDSDVAYIPVPQSTAGNGPAASSVQSALLRLRQHGVDHVAVFDTNGGMTQVLMTAAQTQGYFPRYAVGSGSGIEAYLEAGLIPAQQVAGIVGLGWIPMLDLSSADNPDGGRYSSAARRSCLRMQKTAGQTFTSSNAESIALLYCDQFGLLRTALERFTGRPVDRSALTAGVEATASFPTASLGVAGFAAGKHIAVRRAFAWTFASSCGCMRYVGAPVSIA